ncbi:MAG TPA: hypothetical protein VIL74_08925 [Pyrinomonadaceae bacterium]
MIDRDTYFKESADLAGLMPPSAKALALEAQGVFVWLKTCFPFAFEEDFSDDHRKFWMLWWSVILRIREQKKYVALGLPIPDQYHIEEKEYVVLILLGRGLGKSAMVEGSSVMRGALLSGGYCLYICEAQDQADEHLANMKQMIEHPESRLTEFYPSMRIAEKATLENMRAKDRQDIFICENGWIARAKGLEAKLRGIRVGNRRPDDINIDDIDDVSDSIAVSRNKLNRLTANVIPTQARRWATKKVGQNLILETGVVNQIYTGKSDAFAERTTVGVTNTFIEFREGIEYKTYFDEEDGRIKHKILPGARTSWSGVDLQAAQRFLSESGLEVFLAEYQNQFEHLKTLRVFHEFNEKRHVIRWSDFKRVFGTSFIPQKWQTKAAADIGYTKESISAWSFVATAAKNTPLPNHYFLYRGLTFVEQSIDDQAEKIWEEMFPDKTIGKHHFEARQTFADYPELLRLLKTKPRCAEYLTDLRYSPEGNYFKVDQNLPDEDKALAYVTHAAATFQSQIGWWQISHEKSGEQKTLAQKYGLPVQKTKNFGKTSGVSEANHLLRGDYTKPHPFFEDKLNPVTNLYELGKPYVYFVVDDDQFRSPKDDRGLKTHREHIETQRNTPEKMTDLGVSEVVPMKYKSDAGDSFRMWAADYAIPNPAPLTIQEEFEEIVGENPLARVEPESNSLSFDEIARLQQEQNFKRALAVEKMVEIHGEEILYEEPETPVAPDASCDLCRQFFLPGDAIERDARHGEVHSLCLMEKLSLEKAQSGEWWKK